MVEKLKARFDAAAQATRALHARAKTIELPADHMAQLGRLRSDVESLPDEMDRAIEAEGKHGHKAPLVRLLDQAFQHHEDGKDLRFTWLKLHDAWARALEDYHLWETRTMAADKGRKGAEARWASKDDVQAAIKRVALRLDELGDYLQPVELWPQLYAELESAGFRDIKEKTVNGKAFYDLGSGSITYDAFRKQVQRLRK